MKGQSVKEDRRVEAAEAFDRDTMPEGWIKEILSAGFAIIHDKVMVIDPFSENCKVISGSHNLGIALLITMMKTWSSSKVTEN